MLRYFIVFLFLNYAVFGQNPDSVVNAAIQIDNDTQRVNYLYMYGLYFMESDPSLASVCVKNTESAALKSKSLRHLSKSYNLSGILFSKTGQYKKALAYFEKYMKVNASLNDTSLLADGFTSLGNIYLHLKQLQKAENCFLSALNYYNRLNDKLQVAYELINLGVVKHHQKQLTAAKEHYEKALIISKELNNYDIKEICLNNLAQIFSDLGDLEKAIAYNYDALELRELMGLDVNMADSYLSIAEVALKQKNTELAEENLNLAIVLCNQLNYYEGKMIYYKHLSELYSQKNNYQSAYENLKLYQQMNDTFLLMQTEEPVEEFEEITEPNYNYTKPALKNSWLLMLVSLLLIIIPFTLIRYKR